MRESSKYQGIIPAFYACYDDEGKVSRERTKALTEFFVKKGVKGLYVGGSSGECIYQSVAERKEILEAVMEAAKGKLTVIAHVACNNTSAAAPNTDFVIYNIPQLAGVALTMPLFKEMLKNPRVAAVKNSSMPIQDIQMFKMEGGENFVVFNGQDEQLIGGLAIGADGAIGGTYGVMPELYLNIFELCKAGDYAAARKIQYAADAIIYAMCACKGNLYAVMKAIMKIREGLDIGSVRKPLPAVVPEDMEQVKKCAGMIDEAIKAYC